MIRPAQFELVEMRRVRSRHRVVGPRGEDRVHMTTATCACCEETVTAWVTTWSRQRLGFTTSSHDETYGFAQWGNLVIHPALDEPPETHTTSVLYIRVDDADELTAAWPNIVAPENPEYGKRERPTRRSGRQCHPVRRPAPLSASPARRTPGLGSAKEWSFVRGAVCGAFGEDSRRSQGSSVCWRSADPH
jgi:hypothetical protein